MSGRVAVVVFPGTNCEYDVLRALQRVGLKGELVWHGEGSLEGYEAIVIPGGFAHGDYLRPGAIARFSNVMSAIVDSANAGIPTLGICNGFQVLTEAGLLPGALQKNSGLKFLCRPEKLEVVSTSSIVSSTLVKAQIIELPINHFEGNYTISQEGYEKLIENDQVVFRYVDNPNGSMGSIAGISNTAGNVVGMMPHPERASDLLLGSIDGLSVFESLKFKIS
ncbi:MAG: phosphoribosylformylglycinamidine synthase subunit PurQ [Actinomycetota bacterium]|nr:phosphoribosylformylglycinamidine synthase subunit PurQ [Actinomycetota bacterium]